MVTSPGPADSGYLEMRDKPMPRHQDGVVLDAAVARPADLSAVTRCFAALLAVGSSTPSTPVAPRVPS